MAARAQYAAAKIDSISTMAGRDGRAAPKVPMHEFTW
jgi:hypothetical protein